MMEQCHLVRCIEADTHTAFRHVAFHEGMEQVLELFIADARSVVLHDEVEFPLVVLYIEIDNTVLRRIFDSVGEQVVEDGLHEPVIETYLCVLFVRSEVHRDMLLLGYDTEVEEDVLCKRDDVIFLHLQPQFPGLYPTVFEELVDKPEQAAYASLSRLDIFSDGLPG